MVRTGGRDGVGTLALVAGLRPRRLSSTDYYDVLDVDKKATPEEIRKAYLKLSMANHPDKNPGDEAAKRRFQQISEAYQVLSDPKLRSKYDASGSVDGIDFADAADVFSQLFGSPKFEVYIGRLRIASLILFEGDQDAFVAYEKQRLADLILNLTIIIQQYTLSMDLPSYIIAMEEEAKALAKEQHGRRLMYTLGQTYTREARIALTNVLRSSLLRLRAYGRGIGQNLKSATALVKTMVAAKESARIVQECADAQEHTIEHIREQAGQNGAEGEKQLRAALEQQRAETEKVMMQVAEKSLPLIYRTVWTLNTQDITSTTIKVVHGVLDSAANKEERKNRAIAIYELGRIFMSFKEDDTRACPDAATLIADIERAMMSVMSG